MLFSDFKTRGSVLYSKHFFSNFLSDCGKFKSSNLCGNYIKNKFLQGHLTHFHRQFLVLFLMEMFFSANPPKRGWALPIKNNLFVSFVYASLSPLP